LLYDLFSLSAVGSFQDAVAADLIFQKLTYPVAFDLLIVSDQYCIHFTSSFYCSGQSVRIESLYIDKEDRDRYGDTYSAGRETGIPLIDIFLGEHLEEPYRYGIIFCIRPDNYFGEYEVCPWRDKAGQQGVYEDRFRQRKRDP